MVKAKEIYKIDLIKILKEVELDNEETLQSLINIVD